MQFEVAYIPADSGESCEEQERLGIWFEDWNTPFHLGKQDLILSDSSPDTSIPVLKKIRQEFSTYENKMTNIWVVSSLARINIARINPLQFQHGGAGGGTWTHEGLRQRILSPPPYLRLLDLAAYLDLAREPPHQP